MGLEKIRVWPFSFDTILNDFLQEPDNLQQTMENYFGEYGTKLFSEVQNTLTTLNFSRVIFIGHAFNNFASQIPIYSFFKSKEPLPFSWNAFEVTEFHDYIIPQEFDNSSLYIFCSISGESRLIKSSIEQLRTQKVNPKLIWLVTNNPNCGIAKNCGHVFNMCAASEIVLGTKTFQSAIFILYLIAELLMGRNPINDQIKQKCLILISEMMKYRNKWATESDRILNFLGTEFPFLYLIAKGASIASANHGALSAKGYSHIYAEAISVGLFFHGPFQIIDNDFRCILMISDDMGLDFNELLQHLINQMFERLGTGKVVLLVNNQTLAKTYQNHPQILTISYSCELAPLAPIFEMYIMQTVFLEFARKQNMIS